jgi:5-methylcytosine-specific restriction endonuclease McrA
MAIAIPEIMVLIKYNRLPTRDVKFSRENVFHRDKHTCLYCGQVFPIMSLTIDHIHPKSKGGKTTWDNVASACKPCNNYKDNKTLAEAGMKLTKKPVKPTWLNPITGSRGKAQICVSWKKFMDRIDITEEDETT